MQEPTASGLDAEPTDDEIMELLAEHVPLSLLMDLALPAGPASSEVLRAEGLPVEPWWEPR